MAVKKKYQVFISSTYTDLKEERQAAVSAILTAGHIPAGMELFSAGNESQMKVIERWIDESDIYLLILGGRYGSIEEKSGKSYTHLEFEYALKTNKPLFSVVVDEKCTSERVKNLGLEAIEQKHPQKLEEFRRTVCSNIVRFWIDEKDIKISILETLNDFAQRFDLVGWVPANEVVDTKPMAEELARLTKQNEEMRLQLNQLPKVNELYNDLTFDEMYSEIAKIKLPEFNFNFNSSGQKIRIDNQINEIKEIERILSEYNEIEELNMLHAFIALNKHFNVTEGIEYSDKILSALATTLEDFGLIEALPSEDTYASFYRLTETGLRFKLKLKRLISTKLI